MHEFRNEDPNCVSLHPTGFQVLLVHVLTIATRSSLSHPLQFFNTYFYWNSLPHFRNKYGF